MKTEIFVENAAGWRRGGRDSHMPPLASRSKQVYNANVMKKLFSTIVHAVLLVLIPACFCPAQDYATLKLTHEISGFTGSRDFQTIYAVALDETDDTLTVLAGPPLSLNVYGLFAAEPLRRTPLELSITQPVTMWRCGGRRTVIVSGNDYYAFTDDGLPDEQFRLPDDFPASISGALCTRQGTTIVWEKQKGTLADIGPDGKTIFKIGANTNSKKSADETLHLPLDAAASPLGDIFVIDGQSAGIKKFDYKGAFNRVSVENNIQSDFYELLDPRLIALDINGGIWVFDQANLSLKVFDDFGFPKFMVMNSSDMGFVFISPKWMKIDRMNHLIILDEGSTSIKIYDLNESGG
jgi:hypothetical protein